MARKQEQPPTTESPATAQRRSRRQGALAGLAIAGIGLSAAFLPNRGGSANTSVRTEQPGITAPAPTTVPESTTVATANTIKVATTDSTIKSNTAPTHGQNVTGDQFVQQPDGSTKNVKTVNAPYPQGQGETSTTTGQNVTGDQFEQNPDGSTQHTGTITAPYGPEDQNPTSTTVPQ